MGKVFAVVVTLITLVSIAFFVMHTWWLPPNISTTGKAVDHQLEETLIGTGVLISFFQVWRVLGNIDVVHVFWVALRSEVAGIL